MTIPPMPWGARLLHQLRVLRARLGKLGGRGPGSAAYGRQVREEIDHYRGVFGEKSGSVFEPAPPVWDAVMGRVAERIRERTGADVTGNVVRRLAGAREPRMLSLGCGAGGVEMGIAREIPGARITALDLNPELLRIGEEQARRENLAITFEQADLNTAKLPGGFQVVFCHASLHHILRLEHVFDGIREALAEGGVLIAVDVITRNGHRMWPETRKLAQSIFETLPEPYRVNHTAYPQPWADRKIYDQDSSIRGMECVRSEDILPLVRARFEEQVFVPLLSLARRFFDTMYGPNYDLDRPLDRAIFEWIWQMDCDGLESGRLRPESFFGVYSNKP